MVSVAVITEGLLCLRIRAPVQSHAHPDPDRLIKAAAGLLQQQHCLQLLMVESSLLIMHEPKGCD